MLFYNPSGNERLNAERESVMQGEFGGADENIPDISEQRSARAGRRSFLASRFDLDDHMTTPRVGTLRFPRRGLRARVTVIRALYDWRVMCPRAGTVAARVAVEADDSGKKI